CLLSNDLDLGDSKRGAFAKQSEYELLHYQRRIRQWRKPRGTDRRRRDLSEACDICRGGKQNLASIPEHNRCGESADRERSGSHRQGSLAERERRCCCAKCRRPAQRQEQTW